MKVTLINYTGNGSPDPARLAMNMLIFAKSTRLRMSPALMQEIEAMSDEQRSREVEYVSLTVPSSWEFLDYTFLIEDVTRVFTHQLVRTRTGSYAQQSMRIIDMDGFGYDTGPTIGDSVRLRKIYMDEMDRINNTYRELIQAGAAIEDARGVLPNNIHTNILAKFNLRSLSDTIHKRSTSRIQGEYRSVIAGMKEAVLAVHPFAEVFFSRTFDRAASDLETQINASGLSREEKLAMVKLLDEMRKP